VYHINAVDTVTQWQVVDAHPDNVENLKPVLEAILHQFPFLILVFMSTTVRSTSTTHRRNDGSDDGGVHEKPGLPEPGQRTGGREERAIIRKLMGYGHIPSEHAETLQKFYRRS